MSTPSTFARVRRAAFAAVVPLALLAGCSDNPEPKPMPSPAASATPTDEPSASPVAAPVLPPEARENTPEGAEAFVRYWVEVLNSTRTGAGGQVVLDLSAESCAQCVAISETAEEIAGGELRVDGGDWSVASSTIDPNEPPEGDLIVVTRIEIDEGTVTRPSATPSPTRASTKSISFVLAWRNEWVVLEIRTPT